jgi:hypothetical protein
MTDTVRERLEKAEEVAAKIERKLAYIVGTHCGVATNDLRILLDAYFDQKDLLFECVAYGDPEIESRLAASPQEAAPTKREAALAELAKLDGETMDLAASPQGEESPPAMSADHIPDAGNMIAPVEAVAWRLRRVGVARWNLWDLNPCVDTPAYANAAEWEVQSLYTHPAPIKPSGDTGELRERVAKLIIDWPFNIHEQDGANEIADAILDLIQSERAG